MHWEAHTLPGLGVGAGKRQGPGRAGPHTCRTTSTGDRTAGEPQRVRTNRTVLQTRRQMKMRGMKISFLSATEAWRCSRCASERMGRYSDSASCCVGDAENRGERGGLPCRPHPTACCAAPCGGSEPRMTFLVSGHRAGSSPPGLACTAPPRPTNPHPSRYPGPQTLSCCCHPRPSSGQDLQAPPSKESQNPDALSTATATSPVQVPPPLLWAAASLS